MSSLPRVQASPALLPRALVSLGALFAIGWAALGYASGAARAGPGFTTELLALAVVGALTRRYGIPLPRNGFSSYVPGVVADPPLAARWARTVYACSALLALGWLRLLHAELRVAAALPLALALTIATVGSLSVIRRAARADQLQLVHGLSQAIAADINLARSFARIQELTRRLVPWEQMGFSRYDAQTNEMALIADTALPAGERSSARFDAEAGVAGEAVRLGRPLVARGTRGEPGGLPGRQQPGSEVLVPLYHGGQLVGLWSVRHSDPEMYRDSDGDLLALLAPQLALMLAVDGSVQPMVGASERTSAYIQTLSSTTQEIHASSQEVAAAAQRASHGAREAAGLVSAVARESDELKQRAGEVVAAGEQTRQAGAQMEQTTDRVRQATHAAARRLTDL